MHHHFQLGGIMNLVTDQRAVIINKGNIRKIILKGQFLKFLGDTLEVTNIYDKISLTNIKIETALMDSRFKEAVVIYEIFDNEIGLLFEDGRYKSLFKSGKYVYWKSEINRELLKIDLTNPEISLKIDRILLQKTEIKEFIASYSIEPYQKGLLFIDNKLEKVLESGNFFFWKGEKSISLQKIDLRQQQLEVSGQEIMTKEKIPLRINFYCQYKIEDIKKVYIEIQEYEKQFYILIQLALREYIGSITLDEILERKIEVEKYINDKIAEKGNDMGLKIISSGIKDIILPGEIKDIINQVLIAEKKAQANVITRREETASTRSLLNTAKLLEENKTLYHLKELEYIERISEKITQLSISGSGTQLLDELKKIFIPRPI